MKKNQKTVQSTLLPHSPTVLRFSPTAWAKLLFLRDAGDTEIGGFGISAPDDLLFVEDVHLVAQNCCWVHVEFDDESVANFFDSQVDLGRSPQEFGRLWLHTHPGNSAEPSGTDEVTFARVFGQSDWAVMFILARGGQTYARLRYNVGPGAELKIPVEIDYSRPFTASKIDAWNEEYAANVRVPPPDPPEPAKSQMAPVRATGDDEFFDDWWCDSWDNSADFRESHEETENGYIRDI